MLERSLRKPGSTPLKKEQFSQEMHLNIPLLGRGLESSNYKPDCRVVALHYVVK